jgi:hypothetical protein
MSHTSHLPVATERQFNFNYCKSTFKFLIFCLWKKLLLFNYNIQNNLTIIVTTMSQGAEAKRHLTLELGDLEETLVSTKRNGRRRKLQNKI